jgi:anti-sigma28 factor (negative regulator of flagellin synthesis)
MEIRGNNHHANESSRRNFEERRQQALSESQDRVLAARQELERLAMLRGAKFRDLRQTDQAGPEAVSARRGGDSLEISERAQALAAGDRAQDGRAERVEELRRLHEAGELNTPERAQRSAEGLLRSREG